MIFASLKAGYALAGFGRWCFAPLAVNNCHFCKEDPCNCCEGLVAVAVAFATRVYSSCAPGLLFSKWDMQVGLITFHCRRW
jgi:hypothetical protein